MHRAALIALALLAAQAALARDVTGDMLRRAVEGRPPTPSDRQTAEELLSDWVNIGPDDPALQRALQRIARGSAPAEEQMPALTRMLDVYSVKRAEVEQREREPGGQAVSQAKPRGGVAGVTRRAVNRARGNVLAVGLIGAAVVASGMGWVLVARKRRRT